MFYVIIWKERLIPRKVPHEAMNLLRAQQDVGTDGLRHVHHEPRDKTLREGDGEVHQNIETETSIVDRFKGRLALSKSALLNIPVNKED